MENEGDAPVPSSTVVVTLGSGLSLQSLTPALPASGITGTIAISINSAIAAKSSLEVRADRQHVGRRCTPGRCEAGQIGPGV